MQRARHPYRLLFLVVTVMLTAGACIADAAQKPNFIVVLADDLGYGDLACYGAKDIATPHIDQMAREGAKFTSCYVASVCSPTRASLMTGCIAQRVGIGGVLFPRNDFGLNPDEKTLPELLKAQGYATAIIGKWHLGNQDMFQPLKHGFDTWFGTPASNSQGYDPKLKQFAPDCVWREGHTRESILKMKEAPCPLVRDNVVIEVPADQTQFTQRYTREAIRFITENKSKPFFLYLPHNMPHIPLHASADFVGKSQRGKYGDAVQELDWSTGEILRTLKELGLDENTLVIFLSDNGPNTATGGKAGPLKGGKGSTLEGGVRVPFVARWPEKIPAGTVSAEAVTCMDLLPTLTKLAGGEVPNDRVIDGKDIWPLLAGKPDAKSPHEAIYYLRGRGDGGIRVGDWKYLAEEPSDKRGAKSEVELTAEEQKLSRKERNALIKKRSKAATEKSEPSAVLYNLSADIGEQNNLFAKHPEIVAKLKKQLEDFHKEFQGNTRPAGVAAQNAGGAKEERLYVALDGNDAWSGKLPEANANKADGPLATLDAARKRVRQKIAAGLSSPVTVMIRGGEYPMRETVVFTPEDSGTEAFPIAYKAYTGETPVFTGGLKLTKWKPVESDPKGVSDAAKGKLWAAEIPAELKGKWQITSLFDATKLLKRSRSPEFSVPSAHKQDRANAQPKDVRKLLKFGDPAVTFDRTITYENEDLKPWENITDIEIHMQPKHHWLMNLLPLESIDPGTKTAKFTVDPTYGFSGKGKRGKDEGNKYYVENAIEYLDEPGEWCFNCLEGRVYIWPETPLEEADIRAPYLQEFIRVEGVEDKEKAKYLTFAGLTFRHGLRDTWMPGDKSLQHDWEMYDKGNAILRLRHAEHCIVKSCVFEASSGTGVRLDLFNQHHTIKDSVFAHIGGTAILLSGYAPGLKDESKFNTVTNNYIHYVGTIYQHSPGIFIAQSGHNTITHNTIQDLDYNAMVISGCRPHELAYYETLKNRREWVSSLRVDEIKPYLEKVKQVLEKQWLNSDVSLFEDLLHARENRIAYNDISRCMLKLGDGNAIYFSGMGKDNICEFNYIHDVANNRGFIRLDDNSGYTYIRNNVFERGRMMFALKWDCEYTNNFCIDGNQMTNKEWYPAALDKVIFYSSNPKAELMGKETWVDSADHKVSTSFKTVSNSIFFVEGRAKEFKNGQELMAKDNRGAEVGMLFVDPMFDKEAMKQRIYRFLPGSPAIKLGIQPIDLSSAGSTLAPKLPTE